MKVGDLVKVDPLRASRCKHKSFVSIITAVCLPEEQVNGMHLIEVLQSGMKQWYPIGCIRVIRESR